MSTLLNPYFGEFGGMYVPQILMPALRQLEEAFVSAQKDPAFQAEFTDLLKNYAGRPTALTKCRNLTDGTRTTLYLKRCDEGCPFAMLHVKSSFMKFVIRT